MKGFTIMLIVFVIMLSLVFCEEIYVNKTAEKLASKLDYESIKTKEDLEIIIDEWQKNEKLLRFLINHKELEKITLELETAHEFHSSGNEDFYKAYLMRSKEKIKNLPEY